MFFFVAFVVLVPLAWTFPDVACTGGLIYPELTVFWVDVMAIFFIEGLTLPGSAMRQAAPRINFHAGSQAFNLGIIPATTWWVITRLAAAGWVGAGSVDGFLALACVPCTTSMCVMLSARSGGNAPLAAFNAVLSNAIAVVFTPTALSCLTATNPAVDRRWLAIGLVFKMVLPQLAGQVCGAWACSCRACAPVCVCG